jgi:hypothetical protein
MPGLDGTPATSAQVTSVRNGWPTGAAQIASPDPKGTQAVSPSSPSRTGTAGQSSPVRWYVRTGEVRVFGELKWRANTVHA